MLAFSALVLAAACALPPGVEGNAGASLLFKQHVASYALEPALEVGAGYRVREAWLLGAGARLGLAKAAPEAYVRFSAAPVLDRWVPSAGLEVGLSARTRFPRGNPLLRETRRAMEEDVGPFYVAARAEPLSFRWDRWRCSALELHVGTHLPHAGRTLRLQLGLLTVGWTP